MKKTLLVTSLICSGLALGSLSQNAKADETQDQIEAQGNQQIQYYWNQYQQGLQERQQAWEQGHGDRFSNAYITADAKAGAMYQEWLRSQTRLGDELHNYDVSQYEKQQNQKPQDNTNGSTLTNKQSVTLQQPSENDTNTILSSFTKDSGISTTQDGVSYAVNPQNDGYQIELSQNMGQYNHLLAIYNYNPTTHTYKQIGGTYQADVPMGESLKQNNGNQENSKPVNSQQLGLNDVAIWTDQYGITHHVHSNGMDRQTISGSTQIKCQDWYGAFPDNAIIKDSDSVQHMTRQEYKQYLQSQQQDNQHPYGKGLFISNDNNQSTHSQANQDQTNQVNQTQAKELPQTGNDNKTELGGLVLAGLTTMFALGKRKEKY